MSDTVLTEQRGRVLLITLNRPEARNAIDTDLSQGVLAAVRQLDEDDGLSVGVLTGAGRGFCSGMDLKAFVASGPPVGLAEFFANGARKPLIAAIEGFALAGGLELALACDLLVAAGDAKLGIPEAGVGLFAGGGAAFRLPTRVGVRHGHGDGADRRPDHRRAGPRPRARQPSGRARSGGRGRHGAGRADRPQRTAVGGHQQARRPRVAGHDRGGGVGVPGAAAGGGLPLGGCPGGRHGLRREADADLDAGD